MNTKTKVVKKEWSEMTPAEKLQTGISEMMEYFNANFTAHELIQWHSRCNNATLWYQRVNQSGPIPAGGQLLYTMGYTIIDAMTRPMPGNKRQGAIEKAVCLFADEYDEKELKEALAEILSALSLEYVKHILDTPESVQELFSPIMKLMELATFFDSYWWAKEKINENK